MDIIDKTLHSLPNALSSVSVPDLGSLPIPTDWAHDAVKSAGNLLEPLTDTFRGSRRSSLFTDRRVIVTAAGLAAVGITIVVLRKRRNAGDPSGHVVPAPDSAAPAPDTPARDRVRSAA